MEDYILVRTRRKSIGIMLTVEGKLKVYAPLKLPLHVINASIDEHRDYIERRRLKVLEKSVKPKSYTEGEQFLFMGNAYTLRHSSGMNEMICIKDGELLVSENYREHAKDVILWWYKDQAQRLLVQRTLIHSTTLLLRHKKVKISNSKTRWGSCSTNGSINLNWRLIMAPMQVIDLVIIHELMHLNQMDHSKKFHQKVEQLIPDCKVWNNWLRKNGRYLFF